MGRYLVDLLSGDPDNDIYITSRSEHQTSQKNIHYILGNAHDNTFVSQLAREFEWDGIVDFMIYSKEEFEDRVTMLLSMTKQYILLSSARVYADSNQPLTEESPRLIDVVDDISFKTSKKYAIAKAQEENILIESDKRNWTIIRPYITYSNVRFQLGVFEKEDWLYRALHGRSIVFSKDIANKYTTMTWGGCVSKGIASVIGKESALGQVFHITNNSSIKWDDVLKIYTDILSDFSYKPSVFYTLNTSDVTSQEEKVKYDRIYNRFFDNSKINSYIDVNDFIDEKEGIKTCMEQFLSNPTFKKINWVTQARMDRLLGEKTSLSEINNGMDKIKYFVLRYIIDYRTLHFLMKR